MIEAEFDLAEYRFDGGQHSHSFIWDGAASWGDDTDRLVLKSSGGGSVGRRVEEIEAQLLYARSIGGGFAVLGGIRHEFRPHPHLTYAAAGIEGEAAPGLAVEGWAFLSQQGDLTGEAKAIYDADVAPGLVLQPRAALGYAAQDVPAQSLGAGLTDAELGVRLRYVLADAFQPYIGVSHERLLGETADIARAAGDVVRATNYVVGLSATF